MSFLYSKNKIIFCLLIAIFFSAVFVFARDPSFEVAPFAGPTIQNTAVSPASGNAGQIFTITADALDISGVASVIAHIQIPDETDIALVTLYDDGTHSDGAAGDGKYGNTWDSTGKAVGTYFIDIVANDTLGYFSEDENGASFNITSGTTTTTTTSTTIPTTTTTTIPATTTTTTTSTTSTTSTTTTIPSTTTTTTTTIPCIPTCATGPGCSAAAIVNAHTTADICCGVGESCYECDAGYSWDGSICATDCSSNNIKNNTKYDSKETFLIADTDWRDVLSLVPIAIWNESGTIHKHPALIYHHETATKFDADSTIHFMQMYDPSHLTTIGNIPANLNNLFIAAEPVGAGMNAGNISNILPSDYFSYWSTIDSLVVVDYNDYKTGLMASVFASHKNSPIIFVNSANLATYQAMINGKTIYTVGTLDAATQSYITSNAGCEVNYTLEEVQKWYAAETSSDKLILVNPMDLGIELNVNFTPEKSAQISHLFSKMSLSSPFLAAAKQEVIAYTELSDPGSNGGCSSNAAITANIATADSDALYAINNLFSAQPKYLTIIAAPRAIPESKYISCLLESQYRDPVDWKYGSLDESKYDLAAGRIYGITAADASSYAAKSIFFDQLINKMYGTTYTGISVAHSFTDSEDDVEKIKQKTTASGYNSICFVGSSGHSDCTQKKSPAVSNYQNKRFIIFSDHGYVNEWSQTLNSNQIPWLDLPHIITEACLTSNFWQGGKEDTFGPNAIRKGAIGYWGAAGIELSYLGWGQPYLSMLELTGSSHDTITIGEVRRPPYPTHPIVHYSFLLGDPTIQLKLKQVTW